MTDQVRQEPATLTLDVVVVRGVVELGGPSVETVVVVLGGSCTVRLPDGTRWDDVGERADVFDGVATSFYLPPGTTATVESDDATVAVVSSVVSSVVSAVARTAGAPYLVRPGQVSVQQRGTGSWAREVHDLVGPDDPAERLLVGETFSGSGVWSSYPPHKHDRHAPPDEHALEEVFLVRVRPASGFAVFVHYPDADGPRDASVVTDGQTVTVHSGFHSFAVAAEHQLYYLWALAGDERELRFATDARDRWILDRETR